MPNIFCENCRDVFPDEKTFRTHTCKTEEILEQARAAKSHQDHLRTRIKQLEEDINRLKAQLITKGES